MPDINITSGVRIHTILNIYNVSSRPLKVTVSDRSSHLLRFQVCVGERNVGQHEEIRTVQRLRLVGGLDGILDVHLLHREGRERIVDVHHLNLGFWVVVAEEVVECLLDRPRLLQQPVRHLELLGDLLQLGIGLHVIIVINQY
jgi:hypothetical protein